MPIRPEHRWLYPIDWPQLSFIVRFVRARGRCQRCGRPHLKYVRHLGDGCWWDEESASWRNGNGRRARIRPDKSAVMLVRVTRVILSAAHLDHDPTNNKISNLKAFCQRCHMLNDRVEHQRRRSLTYRKRRALGDLFDGPYPTF